MKYLETFENKGKDKISIFQMKSDLNDIFVDFIQDKRVSYFLDHKKYYGIEGIIITISKKSYDGDDNSSGEFRFTQEGIDDIIRSYNYAKDNGWQTTFQYSVENTMKKFYVVRDRIRNFDTQWMTEDWPSTRVIKLTFV